MASYTDQISQFNPYVSRLPLIQEMASATQEKQQKYDQGVQKIQGYIDNIAGMPVANDVDKAYLQSKLGELGNNLKIVAAGDFSNSQLVNSVGGMATQIVKDPTIQTAVSSTAQLRREQEKMQKAIDDGKSSPANDANFQKAANKYLSATTAGTKFTSSYNPFFDVDKYTKEAFDAIKPGGYTHDQVFETNADGSTKYEQIPVKNKQTGKVEYHQGAPIFSPVMIRLKKEGRLPQEVEGAINEIMADPRVGRQLQITGEYNYGGVDSEGLVGMLSNQKERKLASYNDRLAQLTLLKNCGVNTADQDTSIQTSIDLLQGNINTINSNYDQLAKQAIDNPESIRGYLHKEQVKSNYTSIYGATRVSEENLNNPGWEANFKLLSEANKQSQFAQNLSWDKNKFGLTEKFTAEQNQLNRDNALLIASMRGKGKGTGTAAPGYGANEGVTYDENSSGISVVAEYQKEKTKAANDFLNSSYGFVYDNMFAGVGDNDRKVQDMVSKGVPREKAIEVVLNNSAKANGEPIESFMTRWGQEAGTKVNQNLATASPSLVDSYNRYRKTSKEYTNIVNRKKDIDKEVANDYGINIDEKLNGANIKDININFNGKPYKLTKEDFYDAAIYMAGHQSALGFLDNDAQREAAKQAEARLQLRGKDFILDTAIDQYGNSITGQHGIATGAFRAGKTAFKSLKGIIGSDSYLKDEQGITVTPLNIGNTSRLFKKGLESAFNIVNDQTMTSALNKTADLLKQTGIIRPNLKLDILTGDAETDRDTYQKMKLIAGNYVANNKNLSPIGDVKTFLEGINKKEPDVVEAKAIMGPNGEPLIQMVSYDANGKSGAMTVAGDEARNLGINVNTLYEPEQVLNVRRQIAQNSTRATSHGNPNDMLTYIQGDAYFEKPDFPRMTNTKPGQDMKANVKYQNGLWYGVVYAKDVNGKQGLQETRGDVDLNTIIKALQVMGPELIPSITNK
jgi:hypothetical protein